MPSRLAILLIWSPLSSEGEFSLLAKRFFSLLFFNSFEIDRVMRHERCSDDESDSYPRIGYQHFIDSSRACLALESGICLAVPW